MYIVGIEPRASGLHTYSKLYYPRLGLPQLLTIAEQMGHECEIFCEEIAPILWDQVRKADMVLVSSLTSTVPRAYELIRMIKEENPKAPVLIGGPHVTFLPEEALDKGADYVFRHEADESFPQFLQWWLSTRDLEELFGVCGLSFKVDDQYEHTSQPPWVDLNTLPTPNLDLIYGYKNPEVIPLITSRGCPWKCEFCSEVAMFGRGYRFRSEEKVIEDLKHYDQRYGKVQIFIADDNAGANEARLGRLCCSIIDNKLIRTFTIQVRLDLAKDTGLLALMNRAGIERAYIGYESINPSSLEQTGKGFTVEEMEGFTKGFHKKGIAIHAMWVLGFDDDTVETVKDTIKACIKWKTETNQFLILVPIPGSDLFDRYKKEGRIFNWDWSKFDGSHVVFHPKNITAIKLQIAVMLYAMPRIYNLGQTLRIFVVNNMRTARAFVSFKRWHPLREFKLSLITLRVRVWANDAVRKMEEPIRKYLKKIPIVHSKARS